MTRRKFISLASMALTALALLFATGQDARAQQNPDCCIYTVDVDGLRDHCFPFKILTNWAGLEDIQVIEKNGVYVFDVPGKCPPAEPFKYATLDPTNGPLVGLGEQGYFKFNDCCYELTVKVDDKGCIIIYIRPC